MDWERCSVRLAMYYSDHIFFLHMVNMYHIWLSIKPGIWGHSSILGDSKHSRSAVGPAVVVNLPPFFEGSNNGQFIR